MITFEQYEKNKERLKKAETLLDDGDKWNSPDPEYQRWAKAYSEILEENLEYESFHKIDWASEEPDSQQANGSS